MKAPILASGSPKFNVHRESSWLTDIEWSKRILFTSIYVSIIIILIAWNAPDVKITKTLQLLLSSDGDESAGYACDESASGRV